MLPKREPFVRALLGSERSLSNDALGSLARLHSRMFLDEPTPLVPVEHLQYLPSRIPGYVKGVQQDAQEYLQAELDAYRQLSHPAGRVFWGMTSARTHCILCGKSGFASPEPFSMIQVPMLEDLQLSGQQEGTPQAQSLEDALNAAMKSSVDTFSDCICPPASRQGDSLCRITVVEVPPAVLTLHLMRFGYDDNGRSTKFQNKVDTPLVLDLAKYKWNKREADKYELSAVVEHVGAELSSGHYMAYIKEGLCWRLFSDQVIHKVSLQEVLSAQAYLLVYVRRAGNTASESALTSTDQQGATAQSRATLSMEQRSCQGSDWTQGDREKLFATIARMEAEEKTRSKPKKKSRRAKQQADNIAKAGIVQTPAQSHAANNASERAVEDLADKSSMPSVAAAASSPAAQPNQAEQPSQVLLREYQAAASTAGSTDAADKVQEDNQSNTAAGAFPPTLPMSLPIIINHAPTAQPTSIQTWPHCTPPASTYSSSALNISTSSCMPGTPSSGTTAAGLQSSVAPEHIPTHSQPATDTVPQSEPRNSGPPPCPMPTVNPAHDPALPLMSSPAATPSIPDADTAANQASAPEADSPAMSVGYQPLWLLVAAVGGVLAYRLYHSRQA